MILNRRHALLGSLAATAPLGMAHAEARPVAPSPVLTEAMTGTATPGMAAVVIRAETAEPEQVAGLRRHGRPDLVKTGDRWHLGSDGKAMTVTLIARLVERGVLSWDRPLSRLLPDLAADMRAEYRNVTLPDLLSHRAGLPENHDDIAFFATFHTDRTPLPVQRLRYIKTALADAPVGHAGGTPSYSNTGLLIAAAVAERATGRSFESLMASEVFRPLGMTGFSFNQTPGLDEPCGHIEGRPADRPTDSNPSMFAPAGAMRFTLADWSRFCIDHLKGEKGRGRILRGETYRFLHSPQGGESFALGWGVAPSVAGRKGPALTHAGSDGNWYALVALFPQTGNGLLLVANAGEAMGGEKAVFAAFRSLVLSVADPVEPA
ncbi:MAG: serine hydrolase [Caulobacter sp.]|nr:serine hydrolase [Caulobacter sp.]